MVDIVYALKKRGIEIGKGWGLTLELWQGQYYTPSLHIMPFYGNVFISLPWLLRFLGAFDNGGMGRSWGFSWRWNNWQDMDLHLNWGTKYKILGMPWAWTHIKREVFDQSGNWVPYIPEYFPEKGNDNRQKWSLPWQYTTKYGRYQEGMAECYIYRQEWRMWFLKWLPIFRKVDTTLNVDFDKEVGSEAGSWKGGVVGTGVSMLPHEEPWEALQRLMSEPRNGRSKAFCR